MPTYKKYCFPKAERLCSKAVIDRLYTEGQRTMVYPFSVRWIEHHGEISPEAVQVMISVAKKRFKHAVDRNRIKRLTRECFRLNKPQLLDSLSKNGVSIVISISYVGDHIFSFSHLHKRYEKLLTTIEGQLNQKQL